MFAEFGWNWHIYTWLVRAIRLLRVAPSLAMAPQLCVCMLAWLGSRQSSSKAPIGRGGQAYWALKTTGAAAAQSVVNSHPGMEPADVVLKPVTVTHVGLLRLVQTGHLYCVDAHQWRLYAPLRTPAFQNQKTKKLGQTNKNNFLSQNQTFSLFFAWVCFVFPGFVCFSRCGPSFSSFRFQTQATKESRNMVPAKALLAAWKGEADDDQTRSHKKNKNSRLLLVFQHFRFKVSQNKKMFFLFFHFRTKKTRENQKNNLSSQNQTSFTQKLRFCFFVLLEFFVCFWFFYWFTWLPSVSLCLLTLSVLGSQILIKVSHSRAWTLCETKLGIG